MMRSRNPFAFCVRPKAGGLSRATLAGLGVAAIALSTVLAPDQSLACACGCGVFDVGTSSMLPTGAGGTAFFELDYQDQNQNWHGTSSAPSNANGDKEIATYFMTAGVQYMFNRAWGVQAELPYWNRTFKTDTNFPDSPSNIASDQWSDIGDIRLKGIYAGFSEDLSTGITFGVKLPTGNFTHDTAVVDSDSQIGTGSTDLLLGAFHRGALTDDNSWTWFAQAALDQPTITQNDYRPGTEIDTAVGVHYNGFSIGDTLITPIAQLIASERTRDSGGASASPVASGYQRLMLSPGIEVDFTKVTLYADAEVPVYDHVIGYQLVAPVLFKLIVGYKF
jgi:hypothetical protein